MLMASNHLEQWHQGDQPYVCGRGLVLRSARNVCLCVRVFFGVPSRFADRCAPVKFLEFARKGMANKLMAEAAENELALI